MSGAFALLMLAQAAAACPPTTDVRLAGGATLVRPVGTAAPLPVERLGPAEPIRRSDAIRHTSAESEKPDSPERPQQCDAKPIHNV